MIQERKNILGENVNISELKNPTLKVIFGSEVEASKIKCGDNCSHNDWYVDGDAYTDWGDSSSS